MVAFLVNLMQVGVGEIPFRHQVMSDDIHQDPRYHMSLCLVSLVIGNSAQSTVRGMATTWRVPRGTKEKDN